MDQDKGQASADVGNRDPEQIKGEIKQTREEFGDTVAAVSEKADVKKQAKAKVSRAKSQATAKKDELAGNVKQAAPASAQEGAQQASETAHQATQQVTQAARENPVPTAALSAFAGGLLAGWILGRRHA
jgi:ElaB/YqjD/DUF883 family membrane-anchored ribosome-binding protein